MQYVFLMSLLIAVSVSASAAGPIPVSITKFTDKSGRSECSYDRVYWRDYLGDGFKEMLANELMKSGKVELFERENIGEIYEGEHNLVNSDEDKSLAKGKFKKAKLTLIGAVTEFEYCAKRDDASVNVGRFARFLGNSEIPDIKIGGGNASAKLAIDVRVIDVETGRVVRTVRAEGQAKDSHFDFESSMGDYSSREKSPMGKAVREAIEKASAEILATL